MPRTEDLPEDLRALGDLNAISISLQSRDDDLKRLILSIWDLWAADHDIGVLSDHAGR